jgi:hypothetical protein
MQLIIFNTTGSTLTFLSGAVSVTGGGNTAVTNTTQQLALATDGSFRSNILQNNIYITDGTNTFGSNDALNYLLAVTQNISPNSDGIGNALTSTTINSKQRLDVNLSAEGVDNTAAPFGTLAIGGIDPTGKLQAFEVVPSGEQFTRDLINVSSQYRAQSITTTAAEALGAATILVNRKVLTITPTNGTVYWGSSSAVTTATGTPLFAFQTLTLAVTDNVHIYLIAEATTDTRIFEGS